jgi:hypothetical protein
MYAKEQCRLVAIRLTLAGGAKYSVESAKLAGATLSVYA